MAVLGAVESVAPSGEGVIEGAAILAGGTDPGAILRAILAHTGQPEAGRRPRLTRQLTPRSTPTP